MSEQRMTRKEASALGGRNGRKPYVYGRSYTPMSCVLPTALVLRMDAVKGAQSRTAFVIAALEAALGCVDETDWS